MNTYDIAILILGIIIDIPIAYALVYMWGRRKFNGINKIVRNLTLWWIIAFTIRHNVVLLSRFESTIGVNTDGQAWDIVFFLANAFVALMTIYGTAILYLTTKDHKDLPH